MFNIENGMIIGTTTAEGEGQIQHRVETHRWALTAQHAVDAFPYIREDSALAEWMIDQGLARLSTVNPLTFSGVGKPTLELTDRGKALRPQWEQEIANRGK